jgi:hypothetical protein
MGMNGVSTSIPASNRSVLSVYEIDRLNQIRCRTFDRNKIEDKTISQIYANNHSDVEVISINGRDFVKRIGDLENIQFYIAIIDPSTGKIIQIGLPATKNPDGSHSFPGADELKIGKDLFALIDKLRAQGLELVMITKDETNAKFNINDDLKTGPDSVLNQLSPYSDPINFDAGHENLRDGQDNFFSKPVDDFCISCGGGAKKESLDVAKADYSAATTSDSPNAYSLATVDLYCGENDNLISLDNLKLIPTIFVVSPIPQQSRPDPQLSLISSNSDTNKIDGGFFFAWNAVSYAETSRNATSNHDSAMAESPFCIDRTPDSTVVCSAKKEPDQNQIFDGIQNLRFFHITEDVRVSDAQKPETHSDRSTLICSTPEVPKRYFIKLSRFSPQEESQIMRLLMNPTERKLWGKLFGLPDEDDAMPVGGSRQVASVHQQAKPAQSISLHVSKVFSKIFQSSPSVQSNSVSQLLANNTNIPVTMPFCVKKEIHVEKSQEEDKKQSGKETNATEKPKENKKPGLKEQEPKHVLQKPSILKKTPIIPGDPEQDEHDDKPDKMRTKKKPEKEKKKEEKSKENREKEKPIEKKNEKQEKKPKDSRPKLIDEQKNELEKKQKSAKETEKEEKKKEEKQKLKNDPAKNSKDKKEKLKVLQDPKLKKEEKRKEKQEKLKAERPKLQEKKEYGIKKSISSNSRTPGKTAETKRKAKPSRKKPSFLLRWILARKKKRKSLRGASS